MIFSSALPKCAQIEAMIQEFVDQPGQHLAPWITVTNHGNHSNHSSGNYSNQSGANYSGNQSGNYSNQSSHPGELTLREVLERWIVKTAQTVSLSQTKDEQLFLS